jgi:hypothetical protein
MATCRRILRTGGTLFAALLVFTSLTSAQTSTARTIWSFEGAPNDGSLPRAGLVLGVRDIFFGVTPYGGSGPCTNATFGAGCGAVFSLTPAWTEAVLYSFPSQAEPRTALTMVKTYLTHPFADSIVLLGIFPDVEGACHPRGNGRYWICGV